MWTWVRARVGLNTVVLPNDDTVLDPYLLCGGICAELDTVLMDLDRPL